MTVDGRQPRYSVGVTLLEAARLMRALGASEALNLDGGGSTTMVVAGQLVNRPSDGTERAVSDALVVAAGMSARGDRRSVALGLLASAAPAGGQEGPSEEAPGGRLGRRRRRRRQRAGQAAGAADRPR